MPPRPVDLLEALRKPALSPLWTHAVTLVTVGAAVGAAAVERADDPLVLPLVVVGALYALVGTWGLAFVERAASALLFTLYFVLESALFVFLLAASDGDAWYAGLPLLSHATLVGSTSRALVAGVGFALLVTLFRDVPAEERAASLFGIASAALFVIVFTLAARRELEWRTRAEALGRELGEANEQLRAYAARAEMQSRLEERNRLAREVHDGLGHYLTAIHVQLEASLVLLERGAENVGAGLLRAQKLARSGLDDVRQSVALMRDDERSPGPSLVERLESLTQEDETDLVATLTIEGAERRVGSTIQHALLRVAQEALTNVRRHAGAREVRLVLGFEEERIVLAILDDGRGSGAAPFGSGLAGMRERMNQLGGTCHVGPRPNGGFRVEVSVPA